MKLNLDLKSLKRKKKFKKGGLSFRPDTYWGILLLIVCVSIIVVVVFGYLIFQKSNKSLGGDLAPVDSVEKIDQARIDDALEYFSKRANKSAEILSSPSPIVDPSR